MVELKSPYVIDRLAEVEQALRRASDWGSEDPELSAYLAGYMIVLLCGVVEDCAEHLVSQRVSVGGDKELTSFLRARVSATFRNPDKQNFNKIVKDFGPECASTYKGRMPEGADDALESIVTNKNALAHGEPSKFNVTLGDVEDYLSRASQVFEVLEEVLAPTPPAPPTATPLRGRRRGRRRGP